MLEALDFAFLVGHHLDVGPGFLERLDRLCEFHLLHPVGRKHGNGAPSQFLCHRHLLEGSSAEAGHAAA
jgi:hypothetical protein